MVKWERRYPEEWSNAERRRAERLAAFVQDSAAEFRRYRERERRAGKTVSPIHLVVGTDGFELLRRAFTHEKGRFEGDGKLNVDGAQIRYRINTGRDPVPTDACALSYSGRRVLTWVAPVELSEVEQEVYERLRNDDIPATRAAEMSRWLTEE